MTTRAAVSSSARWALGVVVAICMLTVSAGPASAHQSPVGCSGSGVLLDLLKDKTNIRSGDTVHYIVRVRNDAQGACDIGNATVLFHCPAENGTATGALSTFASGASFPSGLFMTIGETDCVVTVNPGVSFVQASSELHGTLHDVDGDVDTVDIVKSVLVVIEFCGDRVVNGTESCDDGNTNNNDACRDDCTFCGDGIVNGREVCDDGNANNNDACPNDCAFCGNG